MAWFAHSSEEEKGFEKGFELLTAHTDSASTSTVDQAGCTIVPCPDPLPLPSPRIEGLGMRLDVPLHVR